MEAHYCSTPSRILRITIVNSAMTKPKLQLITNESDNFDDELGILPFTIAIDHSITSPTRKGHIKSPSKTASNNDLVLNSPSSRQNRKGSLNELGKGSPLTPQKLLANRLYDSVASMNETEKYSPRLTHSKLYDDSPLVKNAVGITIESDRSSPAPSVCSSLSQEKSTSSKLSRSKKKRIVKSGSSLFQKAIISIFNNINEDSIKESSSDEDEEYDRDKSNSFSQIQEQVIIRSEPIMVNIRWREQSFTIKTLKFGSVNQIIENCFSYIDFLSLKLNPEVSNFFIGKRYANSPGILIWFAHSVDLKRYNLNKGVYFY